MSRVWFIITYFFDCSGEYKKKKGNDDGGFLIKSYTSVGSSTSRVYLTKAIFPKGPSINDVSPKGEGGGYKKCPKRRRSLVDLRRQGEGGYPKKLKFGETSFMDGPLVM